nr:MAG TPA: hypothetical protein [Caudoviricetes sp.]
MRHLDICDFLSTFWRTEDFTTLVEQLCDFVRGIQTTFQRLLNDSLATFQRLSFATLETFSTFKTTIKILNDFLK